MRFVFAPEWFLNVDVLIEGFSFIILFIFFLLCLRNYKLNKKKNFLYLGLGFLLIALAQLAVIITKFVIYYDTYFTQNVGQLIVTYNIVKSVNIFYYAGFFLHRLLTLAGFYIIYRISVKRTSTDFFLALYFIILSALFGTSIYYFFHITVFIFLVLIIDNYAKVYKKNRNINTKILIAAFSLIALSQVIFILSTVSVMYVIANIIELVSYLILLVLIIRILKYSHLVKK